MGRQPMVQKMKNEMRKTTGPQKAQRQSSRAAQITHVDTLLRTLRTETVLVPLPLPQSLPPPLPDDGFNHFDGISKNICFLRSLNEADPESTA